MKEYETDPVISEKELIENRSQIALKDSDSICAYHRYFFGTYYKHSVKCIHPDHTVHKSDITKRAATLS